MEIGPSPAHGAGMASPAHGVDVPKPSIQKIGQTSQNGVKDLQILEWERFQSTQELQSQRGLVEESLNFGTGRGLTMVAFKPLSSLRGCKP